MAWARRPGKTFADRLILFLVLCVMVVLFWGILGALGHWQDSNYFYEPSVKVVSLEVVSLGGEEHISGKVVNSTEKALPYVRVVFGLYDRSGDLFGSVVREEYVMEPGEIRPFNLWIGDDRVENYNLLFADAWR